MGSEKLNLPQEKFEAILSQPVELALLETELTLDVFDIFQNHTIKTCYGDIVKIVNALRDYSRMLEMSCDEWDLAGLHQAVFEYHAQKLREIADKFQEGIGYDYDAAVEKCMKKAARKAKEDEPGGEAMEMMLLKGKRAAEAKARKAAEKRQSTGLLSAPDGTDMDSPWVDDS